MTWQVLFHDEFGLTRSDMLLSTLRRYVEAMGGTLALVAQFPDRPPMVIHKLGETAPQAA